MEQSQRARLRAGDRNAMGELFDAHAQAVYAYALRTLGDRAGAEDVVSMTFLEVWRLRAKLHEGDEGLRPWVFGIATNVLRNTARAARRHRAALERLGEREPVEDFAEELVARIDAGAELAAVRRALPELRRSEREVFRLCVWVGLDYASAAEALGIPVGTVRSRLSRARARLRSLAEKDLMERREPAAVPGQVGESGFRAARSMQGEIR
ncbi:RNA polymerase sigma factor [Kitasatospora sp. NPDC058218]|uniref:RNA polymerase sigma factor n=1 Tax=Kitasatospora sp. NPDC058218 TaxID=3346385 RepID=UPI0036D8619C